MKFFIVISKKQQQTDPCYRRHDCQGPGPFAVGGHQLPLKSLSDYALAMIITRWTILFLGERFKAKISRDLKVAAAQEWVRRYPTPPKFTKEWSPPADKRARQIVAAVA